MLILKCNYFFVVKFDLRLLLYTVFLIDFDPSDIKRSVFLFSFIMIRFFHLERGSFVIIVAELLCGISLTVVFYILIVA